MLKFNHEFPLICMWNPNEMTPVGKTLGEIDREMQRYVDEANKTLESFSESEARWWNYSVSHRTFEIVVGDPMGNGNIVLCLTDCKNIAGPVRWHNQRLRVIWESRPPDEERSWKFTALDDSVGFRTEAGCFAWQRDFEIARSRSTYLGGEPGNQPK